MQNLRLRRNEFRKEIKVVMLVMKECRLRPDADYFPLFVGDYILGGSMLGSHLAYAVRAKRSLFCSAYSYFLLMCQRGPFIAGLQTRTAQRDRSLLMTRATAVRFVDEVPTQADLDVTKENLSGGFPLRTASQWQNGRKPGNNRLPLLAAGLPKRFRSDGGADPRRFAPVRAPRTYSHGDRR